MNSFSTSQRARSSTLVCSPTRIVRVCWVIVPRFGTGWSRAAMLVTTISGGSCAANRLSTRTRSPKTSSSRILSPERTSRAGNRSGVSFEKRLKSSRRLSASSGVGQTTTRGPGLPSMRAAARSAQDEPQTPSKVPA